MLPRYSCASDATVSSAASANRPRLHRHVRIVRARPDLEDLDDDRRDVIQPTTPIRLRDQRLHLAVRLRAGREQLPEPTIVHHPGQSIARDEEQVTDPYFASVDVGLNVVSRTDAAG